MRERERGSDEPRLFDLPLESEADSEASADAESPPAAPPAAPPESEAAPPPSPPPRRPAEPSELPLFAEQAPGSEPSAASRSAASEPPDRPHPVASADPSEPTRTAGGPVPVPAPPRGPRPAPFRPRLIAALADLGVYLLVLVVGLLGTLMAGAALSLAKAPAFGLFLLSFSFLYGVVSLAFWGQTPGMAAAGVVARGGGDQPLTFGQTGLRWIAGVLTAALLGLPLLLALTGRSLADRLSGSRTLLV